MSDDLQDEFIPEPITDEERLREAELEALRHKITEEKIRGIGTGLSPKPRLKVAV